jgi:signal transduction histidine kinase
MITLADSDKVNILLVDDQPSRLLSYEAVLAELGENLVAVRSGEEALKRLMETDFAVILLDVSMPGMDGFETAELIHQHPRFENTPIIFVTGVHINELDRLQGYRLGAIDYVQVPVIPDILRSKVAVLVELYRKRRSLVGENESLVRANLALQTERAEEFEALSHTLALANIELSTANARLEAEVGERRRAELHMHQLAEKLREADRRKDEFLATLAHELRNPMAPISSALTLLQKEKKNGNAGTRSIEVIDRQLRQLVRLVDDLLDISRITYGRIELRRQRTALAPLLSTAVETASPLIEAMSHRLSTDLPAEPIYVDGDPQRLTQVFGNLLSNACKYTGASGTIELSMRVDGSTVEISVCDNGVGIPSHRIDEVFDLFVQIDTSLDRAQGGLGIGLTLVRRLIEMHGGSVRASSGGAGKGSRFDVRLPLANALEESAQTPQTATARQNESTGRRILIVDDNRDAADTLALSMEIAGHLTRTVYDPRMALDCIAEFAPDIAFLDVGMPKLNGLELAAMIRSSSFGASIILVALTGWGQHEDRRRSYQAGFDYHLVKPADPADIERICRSTGRPDAATADA